MGFGWVGFCVGVVVAVLGFGCGGYCWILWIFVIFVFDLFVCFRVGFGFGVCVGYLILSWVWVFVLC